LASAFRRFSPFLAGFLALSLACRGKGDPVRDALDRMVRGAEARDAPTVIENLAADFRDAGGGDVAEASSTLARYFAAYEAVDLRVKDLTIERAPEAARARFQVEFSGRPRRFGGLDRLLPRTSSYTFDMRLVPEAGRWKVAWASWEVEGGE
jgi:hypothetical protein